MVPNRGEAWLQSLGKETLTPLVRKALKSDSANITDWDYHPLLGGAGGMGEATQTQGLYRFAGSGRDHGETVNWSLILKFSQTEAHGGDSQGGRRERLAYQSGFLENLPGVIAPRCFAVVEIPDGLSLIWLEDIEDSYGKWPLERYGLAARHLGQLNGAWLNGRPLPSEQWLSRNWLRSWVVQAAPMIATFSEALKLPWVRRYIPPDIEQGVLRLWDERESFLSALNRLPQTFCHMDAFRRNLFARRSADGREQTVAVDWAFAGIGAVGEEIAPLIPASVGFNEVKLADLDRLDEISFNGYLEGLHDANWRGDPHTVRFAYDAAAALRYGIGVLHVVLPILTSENHETIIEQITGMSLVDHVEMTIGLDRYLLKLADEARNLLKDIV